MKKSRFWTLWLAVTLGMAFLGYYGYISTRQARLLKQARAYLANSNPKSALLCIRRALSYNPNDVEACRFMADLTESASSSAALLWRSRVVELNPKSTMDRVALVQTAMAFGDYLSATNALEGISAAGKQTAAYHNAAGSVAVAAHQFAAAERHFVAACQLEPTNFAPRMNLAVVRLQSANANALVDARSSLAVLRTNPVLRCQALRELSADALRHQRVEEALAYSDELIHTTNHIFADELLRLDVLRASRESELQSTLTAVQGAAAKDSRKLYELVTWQSGTGGGDKALKWLQSLPAETRTNQPAALLAAQCQAAIRDWAGLYTSLGRQNWGELDLVRHAFQSLALRKKELFSSSNIEWQMALSAAGNRKERLMMLFRLATEWNWTGPSEDLLWTLTRNHPMERWATIALSRNLLTEGRTRSLMTLYNQQASASPTDLSARNNLAMMALLLGAWELRPHDLAREVYHKAPANPVFASTYAFSLHIQRKNDNALKVFEKLTPQQLQDPQVAGYYGVVLHATGNGAKARKYLDLAAKSMLLPEERKLLEEAGATVWSASANQTLADRNSFHNSL